VKHIGIFALVTLALLTALMIYSLTILGEYEEFDKSLSDDYVAAAKRLQELDAQFPLPATRTMDAKRFVVWLESRTSLAELLEARFADKEKLSQLQVRKTRNLALEHLLDSLDARSMGISEYCAISARWRAILARKEFAELQVQWRKVVRTKSNPEGMELPPPATDAKPEELALVKKNASRLQATMEADKLSILLDLIAGGEIPEPPKG